MVPNKPPKGCRKPVVPEKHCGAAIFGLNAGAFLSKTSGNDSGFV